MPSPTTDLFRIDPLTGCKNFLAFVEALAGPTATEAFGVNAVAQVVWAASEDRASILFVEMNHLKEVNQLHGFAYGDSAIHWLGILLREEGLQEVFRVSGVTFAILLTTGTFDEHNMLMERISSRINHEAHQLALPSPAAHLTLLQYDHAPTSLDSVVMQMSEAMVRVKNNPQANSWVVNSKELNIAPQAHESWKPASENDISFAVRWIARMNLYQVFRMGLVLDETQHAAYTDAISGLPNMSAAMIHLEKAIQTAQSSNRIFSVLLIDGDNIRAYNSINYAAGDEMIRDLSAVLKSNLRPGDFVSRWRSGDEFLAILFDTPSNGAKVAGDRFRLAVEEASNSWRFPITISIGVASYPQHGTTIQELIDQAEAALKHAKDGGKNQVVVI